METIYGYLERVTYYNEENSFMVARLKEKGARELTTIVGNLAGINPGESLQLLGKWVHNKQHGRQFLVEKYETRVPATVNGVEKYLSCGLIKGIGPVMAKRIVKLFQLNTLEVIENSPQRLLEVEGIGEKRVEMIVRAWDEHKEVKEIMVFLQGHGVSATYAAKIFKRYGKEAVRTVQANPYRLAADIHGIGFITADKIARCLGVPADSILRAEEGILYVLNQFINEGHVCYPYAPLAEEAVKLLEVIPDVVQQALLNLAASGRVVFENESAVSAVSVASAAAEASGGENLLVYAAPFYQAERNLAQRLITLRDTPARTRPFDAAKAVGWAETKLGFALADKQKEAIALAVTQKLTVITGGPGTGKTTIIWGILQILNALKLKVLLAAPTGRAAKRMQEATGQEAKTIHRLLEFAPHRSGSQRDQNNPLAAEAVIVDEASMIDLILMHSLVKAIPPHAMLILVGDVYQLPSVGPGSVLTSIIDSQQFAVVVLSEIFRQSAQSRIVVNAHRINQGEFPDLRKAEGFRNDFYFINEPEPEQVVQKIIELCKNRIPRSFRFHPVQDVQVLTPMHKGTAGVGNLNLELQKALNPNRTGVTRSGMTYCLGDKVLQRTNNYEKQVYNGDIGWIQSIQLENQEVVVRFEDRQVRYDFVDLDELVLAYAISVHKSQGSEYPVVIMPVLTQHFTLLQRNLLYTGVTRGKNLVILIGTKKALAIAIKNNKTQKRHTRLKERLIDPGLNAPGLIDPVFID